MQNHNKQQNTVLNKTNILTQLPKLTTSRLAVALAAAAGLAASTVTSQAQNATATISDVAAAGGVFDYTITLKNTGTTTLDSFWYAWTQMGNNLSTPITNPGSSLGWVDTAFTGNTSISWQGTAGSVLAVGSSATFTFDSTETPTAITTPPAGGSVVYVTATGYQGFGQNQPGVASPVFYPTLTVVPEPASTGLLAAGALAVVAIGLELRRKRVKAS